MDWITGRRYAWPILAALVIFAILNAAASPAFTDSENWNSMLIGAAPVHHHGDGPNCRRHVGRCRGRFTWWDRSRAWGTCASIASVLVPHGVD